METGIAPADRQRDWPPCLIGRDELNLAEFPLTALAHRVPDDCKELVYRDEIRDQNSGEIIPRRLTITGDAKYGLPTSLDDDVIVALIHMTKEANNFTSRTVPFSRMAAVELLGWPRNGQSLRRLDDSLNRWLGVTLRYQNAWWDKAAQTWVNESFHIIDNLTIYDQQSGRRIRRDPARAAIPLSTFAWNDIVFRSFEAENLKRLDLSLYFRLSLAPSRRAYRFLDKRFYRNPLHKFDLRYFACEHIGFSRDYAAAKIKEKLQPALAELEGVGFLEPMARDDRYEKVGRGEWKIVLRQGKGGEKVASAKAGEPAPSLIAELVGRGVTPKVAARLVGDHPAAFIEGKLEQFDWEMARPKPPKNPAGYLVKSIVDGYNADPAFVPKVEQERQAEAERQSAARAAEDRRRKRAEAAEEKAELKRAAEYWASLTPEGRAEVDAASMTAADPASLSAEAGPFKGAMQRTRREEYIRRMLAGRERHEDG
jgi:Replication initiator protein A